VRSCVIIITGRRGGVYLSYRDLQLYCSRPVIGLLEVFLLCFSSCYSRCTLSLHGNKGRRIVWERSIPRNKRSRKRNKNNKLREFLVETSSSSDVGLFMNELSSKRKLNRHSGSIRSQYIILFSVFITNNREIYISIGMPVVRVLYIIIMYNRWRFYSAMIIFIYFCIFRVRPILYYY